MQKKLRYVRILCLPLIDTFQVSYGIQNWHPALVIMTLKYETNLF